MKREKLTQAEIASHLQEYSGWSMEEAGLTKRFEFQNFAEALAFVNQIGEIAEAADHHPDIKFGWGYAEVASITHDRGGVTDVDLGLVSKIEKIDRNREG